MRKSSSISAAFLLLISAFSGAQAVHIRSGALDLQLDPNQGLVESVLYEGRPLMISKNHALMEVRDIKAGPKFFPVSGRVHTEAQTVVVDGAVSALDLKVELRLQSKLGMIFVESSVTNKREGSRGLVLRLTLPLREETVRWSGDLLHEEAPTKGTLYGGNLYPISSLVDGQGKWGLAAAIPPSAPVSYDSHYRDGDFGLYYYVGLSPLTKAFPNQAHLSGLFFSVDPGSGFRSALDHYYRAFPEYYKVRTEKVGAWCFHMNPATDDLARKSCMFYEAGGEELKLVPGTASVRGAGYESNGYYTSTIWTPAEWAKKNSVPDAIDAGMLVFPYTIVGQRQVYMLPGQELIKDYAEQMRAFSNWTIKPTIPFQNPVLANSFRSVAELKEMIRNSGLHQPDGRMVIQARYYTGSTLTFPLNPSPSLFADSNKMTIAKYNFDYYIPMLLKSQPGLRGVYVDSMGAWNNFVNYRPDHLAAAKYPLNVDLQGNPTMRSLAPHYEYLSELGKRLHAEGRLVFANGINEGGAKNVRHEETDFNAMRPTSRFFLAALSDIGGAESGIQSSTAYLASVRTMMGPKPYAILAKPPASEELIEAYLRRGTAMGILVSLGDLYYSRPELRPSAARLNDVYLPILRQLHAAGWKPVRGITGVDATTSERFGDPGEGPVFFTFYNESNSAKDLQLTLDPAMFKHSYARAVDIASKEKDTVGLEDNHFTLKLAAGQLRVLRLEEAR